MLVIYFFNLSYVHYRLLVETLELHDIGREYALFVAVDKRQFVAEYKKSVGIDHNRNIASFSTVDCNLDKCILSRI